MQMWSWNWWVGDCTARCAYCKACILHSTCTCTVRVLGEASCTVCMLYDTCAFLLVFGIWSLYSTGTLYLEHCTVGNNDFDVFWQKEKYWSRHWSQILDWKDVGDKFTSELFWAHLAVNVKYRYVFVLHAIGISKSAEFYDNFKTIETIEIKFLAEKSKNLNQNIFFKWKHSMWKCWNHSHIWSYKCLLYHVFECEFWKDTSSTRSSVHSTLNHDQGSATLVRIGFTPIRSAL